MSNGYWRGQAQAVIDRVHAGLPHDATLAERKNAVDAAYPFGQRAYFPYKMWIKVRRGYLAKFGYTPHSKKLVETPLERLMRRGKGSD